MRSFIILLSLCSILLVGISIGFVFGFRYDPRDNSEHRPTQTVSIMATYPSKVVYNTEVTTDTEFLQADCAKRGGRLNPCGSVCDPDAVVCATVCALVCEFTETPNDISTTKNDLIRVTHPQSKQMITSPLEIFGEARGPWFFEANFPVFLTDWDGKIIASHYAEAQGEWMTTEFVSFQSVLEFESPLHENAPDFMRRGTLILSKSNASGLPEHDDALEITVYFE
jgi:hypothetical protein